MAATIARNLRRAFINDHRQLSDVARRGQARCSTTWASRLRAARPRAATRRACSRSAAEPSRIDSDRRIGARAGGTRCLRERHLLAQHRARRYRRDRAVSFQPAGIFRGARQRRAAQRERQTVAGRACRGLRNDGAREPRRQQFAAQSRVPHDADVRRLRRDSRGGQAFASDPGEIDLGVRARRRAGVRPDGNVRAFDAEALQPGPRGAQRHYRCRDGAVRFHRARTRYSKASAVSCGRSPTNPTPRQLTAGSRSPISSTSSSSHIRARGRYTMQSTARWRFAASINPSSKTSRISRGAPSRLGALPPEQDTANLPRSAGQPAVFGRRGADKKARRCSSNIATAS